MDRNTSEFTTKVTDLISKHALELDDVWGAFVNIIEGQIAMGGGSFKCPPGDRSYRRTECQIFHDMFGDLPLRPDNKKNYTP